MALIDGELKEKFRDWFAWYQCMDIDDIDFSNETHFSYWDAYRAGYNHAQGKPFITTNQDPYKVIPR